MSGPFNVRKCAFQAEPYSVFDGRWQGNGLNEAISKSKEGKSGTTPLYYITLGGIVDCLWQLLPAHKETCFPKAPKATRETVDKVYFCF